MTTTKRPLEVGDRVAVYAFDPGRRAAREVGQVREVAVDEGVEVLRIEIEGARGYIWGHPKQCRRLVKKPRQRIWVHLERVREFRREGSSIGDLVLLEPFEGATEFVEARRRK